MTATGILLSVAGLALSIKMIVAATSMPTRAPWIIGLLVAGTFGLSLGVIVSAMTGDVSSAAGFAAGAAALLCGQAAWHRIARGIHPVDFIRSLVSHDANQH